MKRSIISGIFPVLMILLIFCLGCKKENRTSALPVVTTLEVQNNSPTTASSGGIIISDGGSSILTSGVCWSINNPPTIEDSISVDAEVNDSFNSMITGLTPYAMYYVRAYATNINGTGYGAVIPRFKPDSIYAGVVDSSIIYKEFSNPITLNPIMDSNMWVAEAMNTIRLSFDSDSMELYVYLKVINPDSLQVIKNSETFIHCRLDIASRDTISFHISHQSYYVGQGHFASFPFVSAFLYHDTLRNDSNWPTFHPGVNLYWNSIWDYPVNIPGPINGYDGGPWYISGPPIRYIGFKFKGRLGWIKVNISDVDNPEFLSYAIQK